jgi:hypothetical protein
MNDGSYQETLFEGDSHGAEFSEDREYRYRLWRMWDPEKPVLAFIMLNPSTADEVELDPTCRRCKGYVEDWGYGKLVVGNIFALRSTDPENLYDHDDPVGPENDAHLQAIVDDADKVIAAWGTHGAHRDRGREVVDLLDADLEALDTTKEGHPCHPLYQPKDIEPVPFDYGGEHDGE